MEREEYQKEKRQRARRSRPDRQNLSLHFQRKTVEEQWGANLVEYLVPVLSKKISPLVLPQWNI